jgi:anhydro-N-acetylmuramic acid kinase
MLGIGVMTGTSLDGVDLCLIEINDNFRNTELIEFESYPYAENMIEKIRNALKKPILSLESITILDFEIGEELAYAINRFIGEKEIDKQEVVFVAIHGQTMWHNSKANGMVPSTLQIGNPSIVSQRTGLTVVSNFREKDIACGGEGAPLVPATEYLLYQDEKKNQVFVNIGGICNLTYLPKNKRKEEVRAFDTGPGNMVMNFLTRHFYELPYDQGGELAAGGKVIAPLFEELCAHPYLKQSIPKSTGREQFGHAFSEEILNNYPAERPEDLLCTLTHFTAYSFVEGLKQLDPVDIIYVAGGGVHNAYLQRCISHYLQIAKMDASLESFAKLSDPDAKEAIAFAVLGYLRLREMPGNLPSATGAQCETILGSITLPN